MSDFASPDVAQVIAARVMKLTPGFRLTVSHSELRRVLPNPGWTAAEWVMESIVGSAYEFRFVEQMETRDVMFERLAAPLEGGLRTYVSPDRRRHFRRRPDGWWESIEIGRTRA